MVSTGEIENLKKSSFVEAREASLPVFDETCTYIGQLVPIGEWIFNSEDIIQQICNWRDESMQFFFSRFHSSIIRTETYLRKLSIGQPGRVLFLIFDGDEKLIGHIGVKDVDECTGGLDNVMRGRSGGHPQLIYFAEKTILDWCFGILQLSLVNLVVLSYNMMSIELHMQFGFITEEISSLRKDEESGEIVHRRVAPQYANVDYTCNRMSLTKERFLSNAEKNI